MCLCCVSLSIFLFHSLSLCTLIFLSDSFSVWCVCVWLGVSVLSASASSLCLCLCLMCVTVSCVFLSGFHGLCLFLFLCLCLACPVPRSPHHPAHGGSGSRALPSCLLAPGSSKLTSFPVLASLPSPLLSGLGGGGRGRKGGQPGGPTPFCLSRLGGWATGPFNGPRQAVLDTSSRRPSLAPPWSGSRQPGQPGQHAAAAAPTRALGPLG